MKAFLLALIMLSLGFGSLSQVEAQLREDLNRSNSSSGVIYNSGSSQHNTGLASLFSGVDMDMGHSYSMNFGSVGGQFQNINAYTNHMGFNFSENLSGNLDVSFLHSPFGNSFAGMSNNSLGTRVMIDRAQLDYQLSPNTHLSIQFSQRPYSPYYFGTNSGLFGRRNHWY